MIVDGTQISLLFVCTVSYPDFAIITTFLYLQQCRSMQNKLHILLPSLSKTNVSHEACWITTFTFVREIRWDSNAGPTYPAINNSLFYFGGAMWFQKEKVLKHPIKCLFSAIGRCSEIKVLVHTFYTDGM